MTPALFYVPEAYSTGGAKLMGRNAAGESFLRGFLEHSRSSEFLAVVHEAANGAAFGAAVRAAGRPEPVQVIDWPGIGALAGRGSAPRRRARRWCCATARCARPA